MVASTMNRFLAFLLLVNVTFAYAQRSTDMVDYPSPPQTAALFKGIASPVSYYTGQPNVSIPLHTIKQDGVEIPISISFNTSGIYVTEEATTIGLGVTLDWGGSIVRSANGSPDEKGFFSNNYIIDDLKEELSKNYSNVSDLSCFPYCDNLPNLQALVDRMVIYHNANDYNDPYKPTPTPVNTDFRPDDFHYNFLGKSGLFKFNQADQKFITFPLDDIKIEKLSTLHTITKFDITKSDGVKVTFGDGAIEYTSKNEINNETYLQTWHIKKIATSNNTSIDFSYLTNKYWKSTIGGYELRIRNPAGGYDSGGAISSYLHYENLIKTITFDEGKLDFIYVNDRIDVPPIAAGMTNAGQPSPRLNKIALYNKSNQIIRTFEFHQSYFTSVSSYPEVDDNRLRLDSISIKDDSSNVIEKYEFAYHSVSPLPSKKSLARDHWGYYNGANGNTQLIPPTLIPTDFSTSGYGNSWSGYDDWHDYYMQTLKGNRFINSNTNKVFTIQKIKFPTGGEREFVFEDHEVRWYELFTQMKNISNDGYDIVDQRFMVQGQSLASATPAPASSTSTQRIVYGNEFAIDGYEDTVLGEPNIYIRSNYVNQSVTTGQLNGWPYKIEIGIEKKDGSTFLPYTGIVIIDRMDPNFVNNPTHMLKLPILPNGIYRFYVKMISPPEYIMNTWLNSSGQIINYGHFTVIGLAYRKKNFNNIRVGGLRIKEIIDKDGNVEYKTEYEYNTPDGYCSGKVVNLPEYKENIETLEPSLMAPFHSPYHGYRICSEAVLPLMKTQGSNVGYTNITKKLIGGAQTIREEFIYSFIPSLQVGNMRQYYYESEPRPWHSGKLLRQKQFNNTALIREDIYDYYGMANEIDKGFTEEINTGLITGYIYQYAGYESDSWNISIDRRVGNPIVVGVGHYYPNLYYFDNRADGVINGVVYDFAVTYVSPILKIPYFRSYTGFDKLKSKTTIEYFGSNSITSVEKYYYDSLSTHLGLTRQEITTALNETISTTYTYPPDLLSDPWMSDLVLANRVGVPVKTEKLVNGVKQFEEKFVYAKDATTGNLLLPKYKYSAKFPNSFPSIPNIGNLEKRVTFDRYDSTGKLLQYTQEGGMSTSVIWGYYKCYPIAKIENATYSQISSYMSALQIASNNGTLSQASFSSLRTALPNAMITTFTFKPLIGVSSIADQKGDVTNYQYDSFGRLQFVRDAENNILSESQYNYRP